jgi:hypothetical protein
MYETRVSGSYYPASDRGYLIDQDVENAKGTPFADSIATNDANNVIIGGYGTDKVLFKDNNDWIESVP